MSDWTDIHERIVVGYHTPQGFQADMVWNTVRPESELAARRRLKKLLAEGKDAELQRWAPVL